MKVWKKLVECACKEEKFLFGVCCLAIECSIMLGAGIMVPELLTVPGGTEQPVSVIDPGEQPWRPVLETVRLWVYYSSGKCFSLFSVIAVMDKTSWACPQAGDAKKAQHSFLSHTFKFTCLTGCWKSKVCVRLGKSVWCVSLLDVRAGCYN